MTRSFSIPLLVGLAALALPVSAAAQALVPEVEITFDTSIANDLAGDGYYSPRNIVAVWVETEAGDFVKTVFQTNSSRRSRLLELNLRMPPGDVDGISGATRLDHATPVTTAWDLTDSAGAPVGNGTYKLLLELADSNSNQGIGTNNLGEYTFTVDGTEKVENPIPGNGFDNISVTYQLVPAPEEEPAPEDPVEEDDGGDNLDDGDTLTTSTRSTVIEGGCRVGGDHGPSGALLLLLGCMALALRRGRKR